MMFIVIAAFTYLKQRASESLLSYPASTNCVGMARLFGGNEQMKQFATYDKEPTKNNKGTGVY